MKPIAEAFASTSISFDAKADKEGRVITWSYTNHWDFPLVVERIDISCGCLSPSTQPVTKEALSIVEPGKSGEISANFAVGGYRGIIRKSLHVKFVGHDDVVELVAEARIPSPVELSIKELTWTHETIDQTQSIDITTGTDQPFKITRLLGVPERLYSVKQEVVIEGRHYRLNITPTGEKGDGIQTLQVHTDSKDSRDQLLAVFLRATMQSSENQSVGTHP